MTPETPRLTGREIVRFLPDFIKDDLLSDDAFRETIDLRLGRVLHFGAEGATLPADAFHEKVSALYDDPSTPQTLAASDGRDVVLLIHPTDGAFLRLQHGDQLFRIPGAFGLRSTPEDRLADFDEALKIAGLPKDALADVRAILAMRRLTSPEIEGLDKTLAQTPWAFARRLVNTFAANTVSLDLLVPSVIEYYQRLVGSGDPGDVDAMAETSVARLGTDLLRSHGSEGAKMAILLSTHGTMLSHIDWSVLDDKDWVSLAEWALIESDPFSQLGFIQVSLWRGSSDTTIDEKLASLARALCALDPTDKDGPIYLLTGLFVLIDGELSRNRVLAGWPPFRRRAAALAQASYILRLTKGHIDTEDFVAWALARNGRRFFMQTHVDLRIEPRWSPNAIEPAQWKSELMGRLNNLSGAMETDAFPKLREVLTGPLKTDLPAQIRFPFAFRPGPLEGGLFPGPPALPPEFEDMLAQSLSADQLEPKTLAALINLQGLFRIPPNKADRAVELIKASGHRLVGADDASDIDAVFSGLAIVACVSRNPDLAAQLRIMCRRRRAETPTPVDDQSEMLLAFVSGAAHAGEEDWARFIGDWVGEIAFAAKDRAKAEALLSDLDTIGTISPVLREKMSRGLAALESLVRAP